MAPGVTGRPVAAGVGRIVATLVATAAIVASVAACAPGGGVTVASFPAGSIGPVMTAGAAAAQTRIELVRVLGEHNLVLQDSQAPFRPVEDLTFTTAPRALYQVILPNAPSEGFIVVYEFADASTAAEAAADQAAYLATGPARVQTPFGARHIVRLVGSTVVLYTWTPEGVADERQPAIQLALETLGVAVRIPA